MDSSAPPGKAFERACRLSQIHGTAMFLNYSENIQLGCGSQAKVQLQVAPRRKEIIA
jgi:hypothetical protein